MSFSRISGLTDEGIRTILATVARRISAKYMYAVDWEEAQGWANLGTAEAIKEFDPTKFQGETRDPTKRMYGSLIHLAFHRAQDEMRSAHVVGRARGGKWCEVSVRAQSISREDGSSMQLEDDAQLDPADVAETAEFMQEFPRMLATASQRRVFDLRYREDRSFPAIASILGISTARVYQIHNQVESHARRYALDVKVCHQDDGVLKTAA